MLAKFTVKTIGRNQLIDITPQIKKIITQSHISDGYCIVHIPHSTAAVTTNDGTGSEVIYDLISLAEGIAPHSTYFKNKGGNSSANLLSSVIGASETVLIANGMPLLDMGQAVYLWEFDGPQTRTVLVNLHSD